MLLIRFWHPEVPLSVRKVLAQVHGKKGGAYEHDTGGTQQKVLSYLDSAEATQRHLSIVDLVSPQLGKDKNSITQH